MLSGAFYLMMWPVRDTSGFGRRRYGKGSISRSWRASAQVLFKAISPSKRGQVIH